uniref:Uncharacterized protein n=1 Tax=Anguilla anguilla TaxID=7936 RepID=A0A0E9WSW3_ANGAN
MRWEEPTRYHRGRSIQGLSSSRDFWVAFVCLFVYRIRFAFKGTLHYLLSPCLCGTLQNEFVVSSLKTIRVNIVRHSFFFLN